MSQANVDAFKRIVDAATHRELEALVDDLHPDIEWHSAILAPIGGDATVSRGHDGVPRMFRDFYNAFAAIRVELMEVRDLGDRVLAIGRIKTRGRESGAGTESPWCYVADFEDGKAIRVRTFTDPREALEAAGVPP